MVAGSKTVLNAIQWRAFQASKMADFRRFVLKAHFVVSQDHNGRHSNSRFFE